MLTLVFLSPFGQRFERSFGLSSLYFLRGPVKIPTEAIIIGLDRASVEWLEFHAIDLAAVSDTLPGCLTPRSVKLLADIRGVGDLPRALHGCLIRELARRDARVIGFDILFRRPLPEDDLFAAEIAEAGRVVLIERIRPVVGQAGSADVAAFLQRHLPSKIFSAAALDTAMFLLNSPSGNFVEGYVRYLPEYPDLGAMPDVAWRHFTGAPGLESVDVSAIQPIWLYGPPKSIPTYTLRDVFDRESSHKLPNSLASVAVFIGVSDPERPGAIDHYEIPISDKHANNIAGVELAATAFLNLVHGRMMWKPDMLTEAAIMFLFGLGVALSARVLPGQRGLIAMIVLTVAYGGFAWWLFISRQVWLPFGVPVYLAAIAAVLLGLGTRYAFARSLVARLVPRQVAELLLKGTDADRHAVHTEQATVMFTDLVGSTAMGDRLTNLDYTAVMNHYYDTATTTIEAHRGMVVEFMGDGILAIFSETVSGPNHATQACEAALALIAGIRDAPNPIVDGHEEHLRLRIGINSGMTATGDIGAKHRYNFKALGDTVNIAARIEEYSREIDGGSGNVILVSNVTCAMSDFPPDRFDDLGAVSLRGKRDATGISRLRS